MAVTLTLDHFSINHGDHTATVWVPDEGQAAGSDDGRLVIRLNVDGGAHIVYHDLATTDPIEAIGAAMGALSQLLRYHLDIANVVSLERGRCVAWDDHRCRLDAGHAADEHDFTGPEQ